MDLSILIINIIVMIATVISCVVAIRAKNETKEIVNMITKKSTDGNTVISNSGENKGVMAKKVTGGVKIGK